MAVTQSMNAADKSQLLDARLAHAVFRLTLGINIFIHGTGRIFGPGARGFAEKTIGEFSGTALPHSWVYASLIAIPYAEAILGVSLVLGLFTRWSLAFGGLLMTVLVFGTAMRSDWNTAGTQMLYALCYYFLLKNLADNYFSIDAMLAKYRTG